MKKNIIGHTAGVADIAIWSLDEICIDNLSILKCYQIEIFIPFHHLLDCIDAPHIQKFEILKSLEKTQESFF
jgi:hypothetical protein